MENTATNRQLFFIIVAAVISYSAVDVSKIITQSAGNGGWFTILLATALFAGLAYAISRLNNLFPGMMIFEYSGKLVGRAGAYLIAVFITIYFLADISIYSIALGNLLQTNYLPDTPNWATVLAAIPVLGFVAYKGVTNTARIVEIYGVILLVVALSTFCIMFMQGDVNHILPLFDPAETGRYIAAVKDAVFPFLGFEVLLVIPFTVKNGKKANKTAILAMAFIGFFYIVDCVTCVMMIGENEILHYNFPVITAIRQVALPQLKLFARIDILYLTVGFLGIVGGMSLLYLCAVELICRMIPKVSRLKVVLFVGAAVFLADISLRNVNDVYDTLKNLLTYAGLAAGGAIPLLLLLIAKVKKHAQKTSD